ncbi:UNVERIFIED_CONTAM: Translocase of chloroplast, chloroplastic [Sesamum angustifolium]|uniref:Translocase of chloroplast, chloroplastic n=1 Tax=Sesamum angustifolium TaxID=2727405 RepID=A0AAW2KHM3_9LAMI
MEQVFNRSVLSSVKKFTKKSSPDVVLYVDRLDAQSKDLNDLPLLKTVTSALGSSIWRSAIVTLTHAASAPPDGPSGSPLSYEVFVSQRCHVVQQSIGHAVGDLRMMSPSLMNPVFFVENHPSCRKNREGQKILPNGQSWRPQLLLLCYSMKILSEASSLSKPQDPFEHRKLFGFRARAPPLPYMLSSMLQSRAHPKLPSDQGGENVDSDVDLDDLSDSDQVEEDEYDQLPPFKPLKKAQLAKLSTEQRKAYFEEYDYRVKLLQKKQWREELRRMREIKKKGKDVATDYGSTEDDVDSGAAAPVAVPLPDICLRKVGYHIDDEVEVEDPLFNDGDDTNRCARIASATHSLSNEIIVYLPSMASVSDSDEEIVSDDEKIHPPALRSVRENVGGTCSEASEEVETLIRLNENPSCSSSHGVFVKEKRPSVGAGHSTKAKPKFLFRLHSQIAKPDEVSAVAECFQERSDLPLECPEPVKGRERRVQMVLKRNKSSFGCRNLDDDDDLPEALDTGLPCCSDDEVFPRSGICGKLQQVMLSEKEKDMDYLKNKAGIS